MARPTLTPHQKSCLDRLVWLSRSGERWVALTSLGSRGGNDKLVAKGYAEVKIKRGPLGGEHRFYRSTTTTPAPCRGHHGRNLAGSCALCGEPRSGADRTTNEKELP